MSRRNSAPNAALAAVAAAPQPSCPASARVVLSAAVNHRRLRRLRPEKHRGDQDPRAIAVVERDECVGRRADLRLMSRR